MSPKLFSLDQVVLSKENSRVLIHLKHSLSFKTIAHGLADGGFNQSIKAACKQTQQLPTLLRQQCWELLRACWQWSANGYNNSQNCCASNVGSCCVRVGSGVQTDATTPNNVGTCSASWEEYNP